MPAEHLLTVDAGTSAGRCLVLRPGAGAVGATRRPWRYDTPPDTGPFGRSFDAEDFWSALVDACREALAEAALAGTDIACVSVTSQRLGIVVIDGDGRVLLTAPNIDARAFMEGLAIDGRMAERIYASTGKLPSLLLAPARLHWLRTHQEPDFRHAAAVLALGDWIAWRLTGELRSERSLAGDCGLLDISERERDLPLLEDLGLPPALLPPLVESGEMVGAVTEAAARETGLAPGTPVVVAGGDTQCALLGMGVEEPGETGIAAGWSCPLQQVTAGPKLDAARRTWTSLHVVPDRWLVESSSADAGHVWDWWCRTLLGESDGALEEAARLAARAGPGSGELLALLGPRAMNAAAMGVHLGGVLMSTPVLGGVGRAELLRAALENIAYALRANLEQAEEVSGRRAQRIAAGGGLTRVPVFARILADVLGRPLEVARKVEVSARGAAVLAARAAGLDEAGLQAATERIDPAPAQAEGYERRYERWRTLAATLDRTMQEPP